MKAINLKWLSLIVIIFFQGQSIHAQTRSNVFDDTTRITWLGIDFSQARYIGSEEASRNAGNLVNSEFTEKYFPAWNNYFLAEPKKFDVAKATNRKHIPFAINVTEAVNSKLKKDFFTENPDDFETLKEKDINELVSHYNFQDQTGIGMLFFAEGLSKGRNEAGAWVTFVNMNTKKVLFTKYMTGKTSGFGFKAYWVNTYHRILEQFGKDYKKLKRSQD